VTAVVARDREADRGHALGDRHEAFVVDEKEVVSAAADRVVLVLYVDELVDSATAERVIGVGACRRELGDAVSGN